MKNSVYLKLFILCPSLDVWERLDSLLRRRIIHRNMQSNNTDGGRFNVERHVFPLWYSNREE